ncbi:NAD(P)H-hydrate dehydratase, partial [Corynebacterium amycolatum]|uniref:NAD(P)H-hydrate dehydratase n=1 Tax=Corynebacterium amycolatum TaxID=43765 RepID=UPI002549E244
MIGPGRGDCSEELAALLRTKVPLVIDADALTALANNDLLKQAVRRREAITILTPHEGEFKRLSDATGTPLERAAAL